MSLLSIIKTHFPACSQRGLPPHFEEAVTNLRQQNDASALRPEEMAMQAGIFRVLAHRHPEQRALHHLSDAADSPIHAQKLTGAYFKRGKSPGDIHSLSRCALQPDGTHQFATSVTFDTSPDRATIARTVAAIVDRELREGNLPPEFRSVLFEDLKEHFKSLVRASDKQHTRDKISVTAQYVLVPAISGGATPSTPTAILQSATLASPDKPGVACVGLDLATNLAAYQQLKSTARPELMIHDPDVMTRLLLAQHGPASSARPPGPGLPLKGVVDQCISYARSASLYKAQGRRPPTHQQPASAFSAYHLDPAHAPDPELRSFLMDVSRHWRPTSSAATNAERFRLVMDAYATFEARRTAAMAAVQAQGSVDLVFPHRDSQASLSESSSTSSDSTWFDHDPAMVQPDQGERNVQPFNAFVPVPFRSYAKSDFASTRL